MWTYSVTLSAWVAGYCVTALFFRGTFMGVPVFLVSSEQDCSADMHKLRKSAATSRRCLEQRISWRYPSLLQSSFIM